MSSEAKPSSNNSSRRQSVVLKHRPSRLSMEGYIYNANSVLEGALDPDTLEVPTELMEKCKGIIAMTIVHAGALLTFYYGTGVMMAKKEDGSGWSPPSAVNVGGTSLGVSVGSKRDDTIIFIMDDETLKDFATKAQTRFGLDAAYAIANKGGDANIGIEAPNKGTTSLVYSKGGFVGLSLQMCTLESSAAQNQAFYGLGKGVKADTILLKDSEDVKVPEGSQVPDLYKKLELLAKGETWTPSEDDVSRSAHFQKLAEDRSIRFVAEKEEEEKAAAEDKPAGEEDKKPAASDE